MKKYIVYRYLDSEDNVIYVGKTSRPLKRRVGEHKTEDLWSNTCVIEYIECDNEADMNCHERYYINFYKPKYNIQDLKDGCPKMTPYPYEWKLYWKRSDETAMISIDVQVLEKIFEILNKELFENQLPMQRIILTKNKKKTTTVNMVDTETIYEYENGYSFSIEIDEKDVYEDIEQALVTLITSMIDIYCEKIIHRKVSSNRGAYRNKRFKQEAENRGLIVERNGKYGWYPIGVEEYIWILCKDYTISNISIFTKRDNTRNERRNKSSTRKYICERTGESVRATKEHILFCVDDFPELVPIFKEKYNIEPMHVI